VAARLGLPLFRVECSAVVSKYIGETEKNLERIFQAADDCDAVLFFDEADAIFGKRTEVQDAHDRYSNLETAYLLQRAERHEGLVLLATNLAANIDPAFTRRLAHVVHFTPPDLERRRAIWWRIWPDRLPLAGDVDLDLLASRFPLTGGSIKNTAVGAAYLAASDPDPALRKVTMAHVLTALAHEYRKLGKAPDAVTSVFAKGMARISLG
jgi:SpoVK/Ycf46/Vps4 family AAA+-type ATPase